MKTIKYLNCEIEYIQSKEDKIITIISYSSVNPEFISCLRRLELLGKRIGIKEVWFPDMPENDLRASWQEIIDKMEYKPCVLGIHPTEKTKINGYKKIL